MRVLSCFPHVRKIATVCLTPSDCHGESVAEWRHRYEIAKNATLPSFNEGFDRIVDEESDSNILTRWRHRCILHTRLTVGSWFIQRQKEWHALASVIPQIDLALTSLRVEFHLLCHGFQKDSANAIGQDGWPLPLVNLSHYYKLYFGGVCLVHRNTPNKIRTHPIYYMDKKHRNALITLSGGIQ